MHLLLNSFPPAVLLVFVAVSVLVLFWPDKIVYAISRSRKLSESLLLRRYYQFAALIALGSILFMVIYELFTTRK